MMKTSYFSHDANAKDDPKIILLIEQLGLEGFGIYWVLIETLRTFKEYKAPLIILPGLARRYNTTTEKMSIVIQKYGLFRLTEDEFFFSQSLLDRMGLMEAKSRRLSEAGRKGNQVKYNNLSLPDRQAIATLSQRKEKKEKENKFIPPTETELVEYVIANGFPKQLGQRAYKSYATAGWNKSDGRPVINWQQSLLNNWFKESNKTASSENKEPIKISTGNYSK